MIRIENRNSMIYWVEFSYKEEKSLKKLPKYVQNFFKGEALESFFYQRDKESSTLFIGLGEAIKEKIQIKEVLAKTVKEMKKYEIFNFSVDISTLIKELGIDSIRDIVEGIMLGFYEEKRFPRQASQEYEISLFGIDESQMGEANHLLKETISVVEGVLFARDMVNLPGNKLRPADFAKEITSFMENTEVEVEQITYDEIKNMGMNALAAVGGSSEFPPCFLILRYKGEPQNKEMTALVGKGVTCDTGGYCLKSAGSMLGIKGDMAGGAAVAGAIFALAKNHIKINVVGLIPICENRISRGSLLPGDVITSYSGKTIEVLNTDAEGRLILADAVSYGIQNEKATRVLDIATLTGAVANMLGFSVGGVISDHQEFFDAFREAYRKSGERYWRLPVYPEHEKMIKSKIADIKNVGEKVCGTITAGIFIKEFADQKPWLHIDIAGTAWVDSPIFEHQSKGATGAGVTSIYYLCSREGD